MTARRCRPGTSSRGSTNRSVMTSDEFRHSPVALPPGCPRRSATPREAGSSPATMRIGNGALALRSECGRCSSGDQDSDARADQFLHDGGQRLGARLGPAVENSNVVAIGPAERGEVLAEGIEKALVLLPRPRLDKADARDLGRGRFPGYCRDASEQQEIAAFHLFTSSAREIAGSRCDLLCELVGSIALTGALDRGRGRRPGRY